VGLTALTALGAQEGSSILYEDVERTVGALLGAAEGVMVGVFVGFLLGRNTGFLVGLPALAGLSEGAGVVSIGAFVVSDLGVSVGAMEGKVEGLEFGISVGVAEGGDDGVTTFEDEGTDVGNIVGSLVILS
jgi:hypothetical protein